MRTIQETINSIQNYRNNNIEYVPLSQSIRRTLAVGIISKVVIPPFDKSAMDGYACNFSELSSDLLCVDTIYAGKEYKGTLHVGECVKIMTGAPIPKGANGVFMNEDSEVLKNGNIRCVNYSSKPNICYKGEDISIGDIIIKKDTYIQTQHIAILASLGEHEIPVYSKYRIGVLATGSELVEVSSELNSSQIRNSNSPMILAKIPEATYYGIVPDSLEIVRSTVQKMIEEQDVIIITGGASDSEFDLVPIVMQELGFQTIVRKVSIQPGKPFLFAHKNSSSFCFGLSGNPVSAFVQFLLFVEPFLNHSESQIIQLPIITDYNRKKSDRDLFVPVKITKQGVEPIIYNGSAHIAAFAEAQGIMRVPQGCISVSKGQKVDVRQL